jgi:DNA-binding MarR family transcriptional regulator
MVRDRDRLWRALNPPPPYYDVRGTTAFGLGAAYRALRGFMASDRWGLGLYEGRDLVLLEIARLGGEATPKRIQASLGVSPNSLSTVLRRSVTAGYVARTRDARDRRTWRLELTTTGQACTRMAAIMWRDADTAMGESLTASEVASLGELARRAATGLRRCDTGR